MQVLQHREAPKDLGHLPEGRSPCPQSPGRPGPTASGKGVGNLFFLRIKAVCQPGGPPACVGQTAWQALPCGPVCFSLEGPDTSRSVRCLEGRPCRALSSDLTPNHRFASFLVTFVTGFVVGKRFCLIFFPAWPETAFRPPAPQPQEVGGEQQAASEGPGPWERHFLTLSRLSLSAPALPPPAGQRGWVDVLSLECEHH